MKIAAILAASVAFAFVFATSSRVSYAAALTQSSSATPPRRVRNSKKIITVKRGDYLYKLARKYGTTVRRLFYANTKIKDPDLIYPGETLVVPSADEQLTPRPWPGSGDPPAKPVATQQSSDADDNGGPSHATVSATVTSTVGSSVWDSLAQCEAGGDWSTNTGNGYYGGLQFTLESWRAVGGTGYPSDASRAEQIALAQKLLVEQGWGAWPACSARLGL